MIPLYKMTELLPIYLNKQSAHITILNRSRLLSDETLQISLERIFERDDADKWMPTRLRKQYRNWARGSAPLVIICNAPMHHQILGTNMQLIKQDLTEMLAQLAKRKGDIHMVTSGDDDLKKLVHEIVGTQQNGMYSHEVTREQFLQL